MKVKNMKKFNSIPQLFLLATVCLPGVFTLTGCGNDSEANGAVDESISATLITLAEPTIGPVEVIESSIGQITSKTSPKIGAEATGRVIRIYVDAGQTVKRGQLLAQLDTKDLELRRDAAQANVKRLEAIVNNLDRLVARNQKLVEQNFISEAMLEEAEAQFAAQSAALNSAESQLAQVNEQIKKTAIRSPVNGVVDNRKISVGDFVAMGQGVFEISTDELLQAKLNFPETLSTSLKVGQTVRLTTDTAPGQIAEGTISEILPNINVGNRALQVITEFNNPGNWRPGASVQGEVIIEARAEALLVPLRSVVLRPAGRVVYVIENGVAQQKVVQTGVRIDDKIEIIGGLDKNVQIALDGAGFLSDEAQVRVQEAIQ